jgi:hypothetical protein
MIAFQSATLGDVAKLPCPYWLAPGATLMDAMAEAPRGVRARVLRWPTLADLLPE